MQNRVAAALHDQAVTASTRLPPGFRQRFIDGFASAASGGFEVSRGQNGGAHVPSGLPTQTAQLVSRLIHDLFVNGFTSAMRPTLAVPVAELLVGALTCLMIKRRRPTAVVAPELEVAVEPAVKRFGTVRNTEPAVMLPDTPARRPRSDHNAMSTEIPPVGRDPAAASKLQILATEHWSLLATRALTYQESLGRVNMFLAILSGAVIALALVAQADRFGLTFRLIAIVMLTVVFVTGVATVGRLKMLNEDDYRWVLAMNRLRHAYLELHPELEPHFMTSQYDDSIGALRTLGIDPAVNRSHSLFYSLFPLPGMVSVIVAADAGAIGSLAAAGFDGSTGAVLLVGIAAFLLAAAVMWAWLWSYRPAPEARFPSPK